MHKYTNAPQKPLNWHTDVITLPGSTFTKGISSKKKRFLRPDNRNCQIFQFSDFLVEIENSLTTSEHSLKTIKKGNDNAHNSSHNL